MRLIVFGLRYLYHRLFSRFYHLGWRVAFGPGVSIRNARHIYLGNNVYLDDGVKLQLPEEHVGNGHRKIKLRIEDKVTVGLGTMISAAKFIHIKKNVLISQYCFIGDHDHEYEDVTRPIREQNLRSVEPVVIEEGAWVGANCTVCSGVTIGRNTVVGANSVVTKDIPAYSVAVGVPAKVIKRYNDKLKEWERVRK